MVVETSDVVRSLRHKEVEGRVGKSPESSRAPERVPKKILKSLQNCSASVEFGIAQCFLIMTVVMFVGRRLEV